MSGGRLQTHLRIGQVRVDVLEILRQRNAGVGLLGSVDPQVEHRASAGQLATGGFVAGQLGFEPAEGIVERATNRIDVLFHAPLVFVLHFQQCLPARLMLTRRAKCRGVQPIGMTEAGLHGLGDIAQPRLVGHRIATARGVQHPAQHGVALLFHGLAPGTGHIGGTAVAASETGGDLLHRAQPVAGLLLETPAQILHLRGRSRAQQLGPLFKAFAPRKACAAAGGVHRLLPAFPALPQAGLKTVVVAVIAHCRPLFLHCAKGS